MAAPTSPAERQITLANGEPSTHGAQRIVRGLGTNVGFPWRETRFVNGQQAGTERWRALITTTRQPPRSEAELMKNPLGLKIEDISWTPDAS
jgi:type IV secretion system protein TrbF